MHVLASAFVEGILVVPYMHIYHRYYYHFYIYYLQKHCNNYHHLSKVYTMFDKHACIYYTFIVVHFIHFYVNRSNMVL